MPFDLERLKNRSLLFFTPARFQSLLIESKTFWFEIEYFLFNVNGARNGKRNMNS